MYGVLATLVNITNSYDKQEIIPEMLELAKFAKHQIQRSMSWMMRTLQTRGSGVLPRWE